MKIIIYKKKPKSKYIIFICSIVQHVRCKLLIFDLNI